MMLHRRPYIRLTEHVDAEIGIIDNEYLINITHCMLPILFDAAGIEVRSGQAGSSVMYLNEQKRNPSWTKKIILETEIRSMNHTSRFKDELDQNGKIRGMLVDLKTGPGEELNLINRVEYKPVINSLHFELINHLTGEGVQITVPVSN